jgi:hypothetical protein
MRAASREDAIAHVRAQYETALGAVIEVSDLHGYTGAGDCHWFFPRGLAVVVLQTSFADLFIISRDGWIDPNWNVALVPSVRRACPAVDVFPLPPDARSFWVDGPAINFPLPYLRGLDGLHHRARYTSRPMCGARPIPFDANDAPPLVVTCLTCVTLP